MPTFHRYTSIAGWPAEPDQVQKDWLQKWEDLLKTPIHVVWANWTQMNRTSREFIELEIPEGDFVIFDCGTYGRARTETNRAYFGDSYGTMNQPDSAGNYNYVSLNWHYQGVRPTAAAESDVPMHRVIFRVAGLNYTVADAQPGSKTVWTRWGLRNFITEAILEHIIPDETWKLISTEAEQGVWVELEKKKAQADLEKMFKQFHKGRENSAKTKLAEATTRHDTAMKSEQQAWEALRLAEIEHRVLRDALEDDDEKLKAEIAALEHSPSFESYGFSNDGRYFEVITRPFYLYKANRKVRVPMGRAKIRMQLVEPHNFYYVPADPKKDGYSWNANGTERMIHPHTGPGGRMCMGSYDGHPRRLVRTGNIAAAFEQALMLLEVYNPRDVGEDANQIFPATKAAAKGNYGPAPAEYLAANGKWYQAGKSPAEKKAAADAKKRMQPKRKKAAVKDTAGLDALLTD